MAKTKGVKPNAPQFEELLSHSHQMRQLPHNPHYPNLTADLAAPPSYSEALVPPYAGATSNLPRQAAGPGYVPCQQAPLTRVIVHGQPTIVHDRKREQYNKKVVKFSTNLALTALLVCFLAYGAFHLYAKRPCFNFVVHKPVEGIKIELNTVVEMHRLVILGSLCLLVLAIFRCCFTRTGYPLFMGLASLGTFIATIYTGYLAYLAFYSPCYPPDTVVRSVNDIVDSAKSFVDKIFSNKEGGSANILITNTNVFQYGEYDRNGLYIFGIDMLIFFLTLTEFLGTL